MRGTLIKDGYDIPFETFLGFDGDKEPDIDLNFSVNTSQEPINIPRNPFGEGYVFRAGTIATIGEKTAYGFARSILKSRILLAPGRRLSGLQADVPE